MEEQETMGGIILRGEPPLPKTIEERPVKFPAKDGAVIRGLLCYPKNKPTTQKALLLHEIEGDTGAAPQVIARRYAQLGFATLRIDFSGHGSRKDEWKRYSPQSMFSDAIDSIDWLDEEFPDISETMLCGFSTGGGIAIMVRALDPRISKTCTLYPVLSFKYNFIAAAYGDDQLMMPLKEWNKYTPWREVDFTKEKIEASLFHSKSFSLTAHTYGAGFIKGCKKIVDEGNDINQLMLSAEVSSPLTVIQGSNDIYVPMPFAILLHAAAKNVFNNPFRLVTMKGMDHYVPPVWKRHVWGEFREAAIGKAENFDPSHRAVTLRPKEKGFVDLYDLLPPPKDQDHAPQIG